MNSRWKNHLTSSGPELGDKYHRPVYENMKAARGLKKIVKEHYYSSN